MAGSTKKPAGPASSPALEALGDVCDLSKQIIAQVGEGIIVYDRDLRYRLWNAFMERISGQPANEVLGKVALEIHPFLHDQGIDHWLRRALEGEISERIEFAFSQDRSGWNGWLQSQIFPLRNAQGTVVGVMSVVRDITARKRAEETEQSSEARYRQLFECHPQPMWIYDLETLRFLAINEAAVRHYGYSRDELASMTIKDIRPPGEVPRLLKKVSHISGEGVDRAGIWRHRKKDGTVIDVDITTYVFTFASRRAEFVLAHDVTKRLRAEQALRESEEKYRTLIEQAEDAIFIADVETGLIVETNKRAEELIGLPREQILGLHQADLHPPGEAERYRTLFLRHADQPGTMTFEEVQVWNRQGHAVPVEVSASVFQLDGRRVIQGIFRDISARRAAEQALQRSEGRYRRLAENVNDVIVTLDLELRITDVSPSVNRLTGYAAEDLWQQPVTRFLSRESAAFVQGIASRELSPEGLARKDASWALLVEVELIRKDGTQVWVEVQVGMLFDEAGRPTALLGIVRNITERHRARLELEKSLSMLTATLESTADGILVVDANGRVETCNQRFIDMCHVPRRVAASNDEDQILASLAGQLKDPAAFRARMAELRSRPEEEISDLLVFQDGRVFERFSKPQRVGGRVVGQVWSYRDITERQRVEAALRLEGAALESAANAIVITNRDGEIVWCNRAFTQLSGYGAAEARGKNPRILKSGLQTPLFYQRMWETITAGQVWRGELVNRRKDGSRCTEEMTITPVRDRAGSITHFIAIKQDIGERKQMEADLRQSHERFMAIFQSSPTPIAITTLAEGRYLDVNEAFLRMMGYKSDEVIGRTVTDLCVWEQSAQRGELKRILEDKGFVSNFEARFRDKAGRFHDCLAAVRVVQLSQEPHLIFITHDITERKLLEAQLRQAQKMESIGTLAGGVAHDFNNILTLIQGHASLVMYHEGLPADCLESIQQVAQAAEQAGNLTRQLLTFSRKQPLQRRRIDLNEVVSNLTKMLRRIIGEDVSLEVRYSPHHLIVLADVGMMEQVLLNLAVNARDAMPNGGELVITTELVQRDPARLPQGTPPGVAEFARLSVRDTGCGIPEENLTRIFDPFFTTKEVGKGTGLGLATVHGIAQQHQGFVEVESQVNVGTTFHLYLPVELRSAHTGTEKPAPIAVRGGRELVLLVEDEQPVRVLARQILEHYGYRVLEADSGQAALPLWRQHRDEIALLLTDMIMPGGLTGRQLAGQLRAEKPGLRVLFSSGYAQDMLRQDAEFQGASAFLQKPYPPQTLAKAVRDCLDGNPA